MISALVLTRANPTAARFVPLTLSLRVLPTGTIWRTGAKASNADHSSPTSLSFAALKPFASQGPKIGPSGVIVTFTSTAPPLRRVLKHQDRVDHRLHGFRRIGEVLDIECSIGPAVLRRDAVQQRLDHEDVVG